LKAKRTFFSSHSLSPQWKTVKFLLFVTHINTHIIIPTFALSAFLSCTSPTRNKGDEKTFARDFILAKTQNLCEKLERGVHDDDCDIKIKINSIPSQKTQTFCLDARNLNARSRFFKFTPCKIKIYDRKNVREKFFVFRWGMETHIWQRRERGIEGIEDGKE
jgi:hypothetical protein